MLFVQTTITKRYVTGDGEKVSLYGYRECNEFGQRVRSPFYCDTEKQPDGRYLIKFLSNYQVKAQCSCNEQCQNFVPADEKSSLPLYLTVPNYGLCLGEQQKNGHPSLCVPDKKFPSCVAESWEMIQQVKVLPNFGLENCAQSFE